MRHQSIAQRYADALFGLAEQSGKLDSLYEQLNDLAAMLQGHGDLAGFWTSPIVGADDQKAVAKQILGGKIDDLLLNTLMLMFDNKRGSAIPALQEAFRTRYDAHRKHLRVSVASALPLDDSETAALRDRLERATSRSVEMEIAIQPDLIGGLVVKVGDQVLDSSLKGRLEALARTLG